MWDGMVPGESLHLRRATAHTRYDQTVVIGWHKGERWCRRTDQASAWARVWPLHPVLQARGVVVSVTKVKRHITQDEIDAGEWTLREKLGNDQADALAGKGVASIYEKMAEQGECGASGWESHLERIDAQSYLTVHRQAPRNREIQAQ